MLKDSIRLIVNSDDYGLSPAVSRGIRDSHKMGIVTSTTVMISVPGCESDVQLALHETPHLALGLHLTLAGMCCPPVLPPSSVPSLVRNDGNFYDEPEWSRYHDLFNA
jgi:chitin disaccharide deacetylase